MLDQMVAHAPLFLLAVFRCFTTLMALPLFSSRTVPRMAKIALALYMGWFIFSSMDLSSGVYAAYARYISADGSFTLEYVFILLGEGLIGLIIGFYIQVIFAAFSTAGQFFAFQMGLSASEVYDSLSQVENPLMGQFLNFMAMVFFLQENWIQRLFLTGLKESFVTLNAFSILDNSQFLALFMMKSLTILFKDALIIALPIMGSLFLINVTVGILSKAAPQMNLLSEGFPILMLVSYFLLFVLIPHLEEFFIGTFTDGFVQIGRLVSGLKASGGM
ncbi:MAG: flagellar biosynthetic protein FliR [Treponema sp.]|nr:flagellar biosynthetic protein FliR [Treponema sp.]